MKLKKFFLGVFSTLSLFPIVAQENDGALVPLAQMSPLEYSEQVVNPHGINAGFSALTSFYYDNQLQQTLILGFYRPYASYLYQENHFFLLRGKWALVQYTKDLQVNDQTIPRKELNSSVGSVEVASANLNFGKQRITVGRSFFMLGRGLLFANFADGAQYERSSFWANYRVMALYSGEYGKSVCALNLSGCGGVNPFDIVPGRALDAQIANAGKRYFLAFEVTSIPIMGQRLYTSFLYSGDLNRDKNLAGEQFSYDPYYLSLGARGFIGNTNLRYLAEYVYQGGKTINRGVDNKKADISAHALQADLFYNIPQLPAKLRTTATFQYAFATGDPDRIDGINASQVNRTGNDQGFYYFGAFSGGFALKPRLMNMHILRPGFFLRPLANLYSLRNFLVSLKYNLYYKVHKSAPTSDPRATEEKPFVGQGFDITALYDFRSDLKFFYVFGYFLPQDAYAKEDQKSLQSHIFSVTLNF